MPTTYRSRYRPHVDYIPTALPTTYRQHTPTALPTTCWLQCRPRCRPHTDNIHWPRYRPHADYIPTALTTTYRPRYRPHTDRAADHMSTIYRPRYRPHADYLRNKSQVGSRKIWQDRQVQTNWLLFSASYFSGSKRASPRFRSGDTARGIINWPNQWETGHYKTIGARIRYRTGIWKRRIMISQWRKDNSRLVNPWSLLALNRSWNHSKQQPDFISSHTYHFT